LAAGIICPCRLGSRFPGWVVGMAADRGVDRRCRGGDGGGVRTRSSDVGVKRELWLVRHGRTDWNHERRFQGRIDHVLNSEGRREAEALVPILRNQTFERVWSSQRRRSLETARLAFGEPTVDTRLDEFDFGEIEGMTWSDLASDMQERLLGFETFVAPGGESVVDFRRRIEDFVAGLGGGRHLIFTHGGVIRILTGITPDPGQHLVIHL